jgi:hypothetical protein
VCIDPVGATGLPIALSRGPQIVGTYQLVAGKPLVTPRLRLLATAHFVPTRVGSKEGEWLPGLEATLIPDADRDGISYRNSVDQHGYDPLRIGTFRISVKSVGAVKGTTTVETLVEDLGCLEDYVHAPLAPGESKTFWVSTEATRKYSFSVGHWYEGIEQMYFLVSSGLGPASQQAPGTKTPHGFIAAQTWETGPSWDDRNLDEITVGRVFQLNRHTVEVLRVVLGPDTSVVDGRVHTKGRDPVVSVLVRATRRLKPLEGLVRHPMGY